jgi:hypothetical protein
MFSWTGSRRVYPLPNGVHDGIVFGESGHQCYFRLHNEQFRRTRIALGKSHAL